MNFTVKEEPATGTEAALAWQQWCLALEQEHEPQCPRSALAANAMFNSVMHTLMHGTHLHPICFALMDKAGIGMHHTTAYPHAWGIEMQRNPAGRRFWYVSRFVSRTLLEYVEDISGPVCFKSEGAAIRARDKANEVTA